MLVKCVKQLTFYYLVKKVWQRSHWPAFEQAKHNWMKWNPQSEILAKLTDIVAIPILLLAESCPDCPRPVPPPLSTFHFVQFHSCNSCPNFVEDLQVTWLVVTKVRSASFTASGWLQRAVTKTHVMLRLFFIVACGIARLLCAMHVFEVRASSSPLGGRKRNEICHKGSLGALGYLYDKFRFFRGLRGARMMLELRIHA